MNLNNARYELTAVKPEQYPVNSLPEAAFVGRSNVGKSSIINTLLNRRNLARVGATPGKTREINFYNIDDQLYLVDLPGYGYANVSKEKKSSWSAVVDTYLHSRGDKLKSLILLVDIRHTPSEDDRLMHEWLKSGGTNYMVVATKADKITRSQINPRLGEISKALGLPAHIKPIAFSAENRLGKEEVWARILENAGLAENKEM